MARKNKKNTIGIDIVEVSRFKSFGKNKKIDHMTKKIFSDREIQYCFQYKDSAVHFAGIFAAKEAVSKALGTEKFPFISLEIFHKNDGAPEVYKDGKKLKVSISISHTESIAVAVALFTT